MLYHTGRTYRIFWNNLLLFRFNLYLSQIYYTIFNNTVHMYILVNLSTSENFTLKLTSPEFTVENSC